MILGPENLQLFRCHRRHTLFHLSAQGILLIKTYILDD
jgi:hypothetical protein